MASFSNVTVLFEAFSRTRNRICLLKQLIVIDFIAFHGYIPTWKTILFFKNRNSEYHSTHQCGIPKEITKPISNKIRKETPKKTPKEISKKTPKDISKDIQKKNTKEIPKKILKEISKGIPMEITK